MAEVWRAQGLFLALALYGLLSVPAPPALRVAEITIGALLAMAVGFRRPVYVLTGHALNEPGTARWELPAVLAFA